ncbi:16S rRNA (cytosine(1402)-N(4))-methyltransferase RsmH [Candidatus Erwinia haradaeae]|uniref:Ribosomal RNA small subunit methyltransferase H n=1 Tax=Candidatus Erwinia haradaeae TaxID=1922217 RepID=A0A803FT54_9GAMM|nr:16S rRNA (cytosine(1402)-N(4))-methyltransferase RsmH [Candidatus Erwinia haradaeae]VFP87674.1 Ribosomal RNA small subunit methyltransferase H [Candidatus Erwinia haradaeae]
MSHTLQHIPVLLEEAVNGLNVRSDGIYIDGTFGCGGHSRLILDRLGQEGCLYAIDRDPQAVSIASKITDSRFTIINGQFSMIEKYVSERRLTRKIDGIILDLGMSSLQVDNPLRGFSFMKDGPLDMRMNPVSGQSAAKKLMNAKEREIYYVLKTFGEERFAWRIAHSIINRNRTSPMTRTRELANLIYSVMPSRSMRKHPATRSFQAIRIWVNNELEEIEQALKGILKILKIGGRLSIITFHSLEDRLVKRFIREHSRGCKVPFRLPISEDRIRYLGHLSLQELGKIKPSKIEIVKNPRARSAILRLAERISL